MNRNFLYYEIKKINNLLISLKNLTNSYDKELKLYFELLIFLN